MPLPIDIKYNYITETLPNGFTFEMVKVEGGTFMMGSNEREREQPIHEVTIPTFYLAKYPVTQTLWENVMKENRSRFKGANRPVESVSWDDAKGFLRKLFGMTGIKFRLPSEVEWEYAARGGIYKSLYGYTGSNDLREVGWYNKNSNRVVQKVGLKLPNCLGLYDMSGNVREWCEDYWHSNYKQAPEDGIPWTIGGNERRRVVRGGSWGLNDILCRVSYRLVRESSSAYISSGFRVARS